MSEASIVIDDAPVEEPIEPPTETPAEPETPPEAPPEPAKVVFDEAQQAVFDKAINKKVAIAREAERERDEAKKAAEEALRRIPEPDRPAVPDLPDPYDDDYEAKMEARDKAVVDRSLFDAQAAYAQQQQQQQVEAENQQRAKKQYDAVVGYTDRADKLGIAAADLQRAGNDVQQSITDPSVVSYIIADEHGPSITMYLHDNPTEVEVIRNMPPMQAAVYISQIKGKAIESRKTPNLAPEPADNPDGAGFAEPDDGVPGVIYE